VWVSKSAWAGNPKLREIDFIGTPFSFQETDWRFDSYPIPAREIRLICFPDENQFSFSSSLMSSEQNLYRDVYEK